MLVEKITDVKYLITFDSPEEANKVLCVANPPYAIKAGEVMKLLNISRPTLCKYVKQGIVKAHKVEGSQYQYDYDSVIRLKTGK